ncbi:hypothetical protein [Arthrobacter globiformis]|uniref:hypothetical protein n=1 Tax=Arthrobacter globiformis TaxID=1665 RepID=UPI002791BE64|nr:hypothetical protein [Arthrobacter globiformis]MDQ0617478.1 hypothetical protein [Arthrobacter globiformis]
MHSGNKDDAGSPDDAEVSHNVNQAPEEILAYWTTERMAEALPRDIRLPDQEETEEN